MIVGPSLTSLADRVVHLVADEGVCRPIANRLRRDGHDEFYITELQPGMDDEGVLARAT